MARRRDAGSAPAPDHGSDGGRIRIDKWLWHARFCKTRALAADLVGAGRLRVNGQRIDKPGRAVGPGDVLTFGMGGTARVLRILACGTRRGPAPEAATLYQDLAPVSAPVSAPETTPELTPPEAAVPPGGSAQEQPF